MSIQPLKSQLHILMTVATRDLHSNRAPEHQPITTHQMPNFKLHFASSQNTVRLHDPISLNHENTALSTPINWPLHHQVNSQPFSFVLSTYNLPVSADKDAPTSKPPRSTSNRTIECAGWRKKTSTRDLEPDAGEYREEMGGYATAGAGGSLDGVEGSNEG